MTSISIRTVKAKLNLILEHLEASGLEDVELNENLYWVIPDKEKYNLDKDPILEVGDASFDVDLIGQIDRPLSLELLYFSEVLRIIAFEGSKRNL